MEDNQWFFIAVYFIAGCFGTVVFFWIGKYILGLDSIKEDLTEIRKILRDKKSIN